MCQRVRHVSFWVSHGDNNNDATHHSSLSLHRQVAPGAALLMRIIEDFIHLIGEAQKPFQSFLVVTNNLSKRDTRAITGYSTAVSIFKDNPLCRYCIELRNSGVNW